MNHYFAESGPFCELTDSVSSESWFPSSMCVISSDVCAALVGQTRQIELDCGTSERVSVHSAKSVGTEVREAFARSYREF